MKTPLKKYKEYSESKVKEYSEKLSEKMIYFLEDIFDDENHESKFLKSPYKA